MLKVHFLNVGKGNCVVIKSPSGNLTLVDIDNSRIDDKNDRLQDPIEFLDAHCPNESIFRFILTHPDMDHLSGLDELTKKRKMINFWDIEHNKVVDLNKMSLGGYSKDDWLAYLELRESEEVPSVHRILHNTTPHSYWKEDEIKVIYPSPK